MRRVRIAPSNKKPLHVRQVVCAPMRQCLAIALYLATAFRSLLGFDTVPLHYQGRPMAMALLRYLRGAAPKIDFSLGMHLGWLKRDDYQQSHYWLHSVNPYAVCKIFPL